jgi:hypothetical protein
MAGEALAYVQGQASGQGPKANAAVFVRLVNFPVTKGFSFGGFFF